jgi:hypothetical protein
MRGKLSSRALIVMGATGVLGLALPEVCGEFFVDPCRCGLAVGDR